MKQDLYFTTKRGEKLCGVLELPDDTKQPVPIVIYCHGFLGSKNMLFASALARGLVRQGFGVYRFDLPGHGKSTGDKYEVTLPRNIEDVSGIIDMLSELPEIDKSRIAVMGHSYGGTTALLVPAFDSRVKVAISLGSALNFKAIINHMIKAGKMIARNGYLYYNLVPFFVKQRCHKTLYPYSQKFDFATESAKVKIPILLINGARDNTIPLRLARETVAALPGKKKLVILSNEGHLFIRPGTKKKLISIIDNWLKDNL
ncbi:alpha/beta hydrolase [Patescibacteria group bacterium]